MFKAKDGTLFSLFALGVAVDQLTKFLGERIQGRLGPFSVEMHHNPGIFLQWLATESSLLRVVSVACFYGFILFIYFSLLSALSLRHQQTKVALTLFLSSITGNAVDRIGNGEVRDFLVLRIADRLFYANVADILMWVSLALLVASAWIYRRDFFPEKNSRIKHVLSRSYQYAWSAKVALASFCSFVTLMLFSVTYFHAAEDFRFIAWGLVIGIFFSAFTAFAAIRFSHRSAGALYAFEKYVEKLLEGKTNEPFSLRENDEHRQLVPLAKKLRAHFIQKGIQR
ncbi:MAG: signal peptidase II [Cryobacterium sp.]|nr:signal peptidase II [Oligoflexia bacterium]